MNTEWNIGDVIFKILMLPLYLINMTLEFLCLLISPFLMLAVIYSIPIDILRFPFAKKKWAATKWVYEDLFGLIWRDTIRDINTITKEYME